MSSATTEPRSDGETPCSLCHYDSVILTNNYKSPTWHLASLHETNLQLQEAENSFSKLNGQLDKGRLIPILGYLILAIDEQQTSLESCLNYITCFFQLHSYQLPDVI